MKKPGKLAIVYMHPEALTPYERNARTHDAAQIEQLKASIVEFGFTNPVLIDEDAMIIAGHARVAAALALGLPLIPTITLTGLSDAQRRAYVLADNRLPMNAGWDLQMLAIEIGELSDLNVDLPMLGFSSVELAQLVGRGDFSPAGQDEQGKLDQLSPIPVVCPQCAHEFNARDHHAKPVDDKPAEPAAAASA